MNGNLYLSCLFFGLVHMMFNGFSELPLMISRLPVFYKQRDNLFHPASAWSVTSWILRVPYSIIEAVVWSCVVYYTVGFAPSAGRYLFFTIVDDVLYACIFLYSLLLSNVSGFPVSCYYSFLYTKWHWVFSGWWLLLHEIWSLRIHLDQLHCWLYSWWADSSFQNVGSKSFIDNRKLCYHFND